MDSKWSFYVTFGVPTLCGSYMQGSTALEHYSSERINWFMELWRAEILLLVHVSFKENVCYTEEEELILPTSKDIMLKTPNAARYIMRIGTLGSQVH